MLKSKSQRRSNVLWNQPPCPLPGPLYVPEKTELPPWKAKRNNNNKREKNIYNQRLIVECDARYVCLGPGSTMGKQPLALSHTDSFDLRFLQLSGYGHASTRLPRAHTSYTRNHWWQFSWHLAITAENKGWYPRPIRRLESLSGAVWDIHRARPCLSVAIYLRGNSSTSAWATRFNAGGWILSILSIFCWHR